MEKQRLNNFLIWSIASCVGLVVLLLFLMSMSNEDPMTFDYKVILFVMLILIGADIGSFLIAISKMNKTKKLIIIIWIAATCVVFLPMPFIMIDLAVEETIAIVTVLCVLSIDIVLMVIYIERERKQEKQKPQVDESPKIKKTILELGTKFSRLQVSDIKDKCGVKNEKLIIKIINEMISKKEIYAEYFPTSKSVAFNQQANIDEIDKLMAAYQDWEKDKVQKKE